MSELTQEVTPLTRAIVWLMPENAGNSHPHYKSLDYILDGLLTATLMNSAGPNHVLVGKNFGRDIFVYCLSTLSAKELESYLGLIQRELSGEDRILVIDDQDKARELEKVLPKSLLPKTNFLK